MIRARPHINGNERRDFIAAALKVNEAGRQMEAALRNIHSNVIHGRNYQHLGDEQATAARDADVVRMQAAWEAFAALNRLAQDIIEAAGE